VHNAADDAPIINPLYTPNIRRQMRLDPSPLLVVQPKQVRARHPDPLPNESQSYGIRIALLQPQN
jgi:hypothetical protein